MKICNLIFVQELFIILFLILQLVHLQVLVMKCYCKCNLDTLTQYTYELHYLAYFPLPPLPVTIWPLARSSQLGTTELPLKNLEADQNHFGTYIRKTSVEQEWWQWRQEESTFQWVNIVYCQPDILCDSSQICIGSDKLGLVVNKQTIWWYSLPLPDWSV